MIVKIPPKDGNHAVIARPDHDPLPVQITGNQLFKDRKRGRSAGYADGDRAIVSGEAIAQSAVEECGDIRIGCTGDQFDIVHAFTT